LKQVPKLALCLALAASYAYAQPPGKPNKSEQARKAHAMFDKAFGVAPSARELNSREYRICMMGAADSLMPNRVDAAPLLAAVAHRMCLHHFRLVLDFDIEEHGAEQGPVKAQAEREALMEEVVELLVKRRAGLKY
jgi:hypothetical protein